MVSYSNKGFFFLFIVILFLGGCSTAGNVAIINEPSPQTPVVLEPQPELVLTLQQANSGNGQSPNKITTRTWQIDKNTLIERSEGLYTRIYLMDDGSTDAKVIGGEAFALEYQKYEKGKLYFVAYGRSPITFPYIFWYDMQSGETGTEKYYLRTGENSFWGQWGEGRLLKEIKIENNQLKFTFGEREDQPTYGLISYFPFTATVYDDNTNELTFCFYQTEVDVSAVDIVETFSGNDYFDLVSIEQRSTGLTIAYSERLWWLYTGDPNEVTNYPAVLVKVKPTQPLQYTVKENPNFFDGGTKAVDYDLTFTLQFAPI